MNWWFLYYFGAGLLGGANLALDIHDGNRWGIAFDLVWAAFGVLFAVADGRAHRRCT